MVSSSPSRYGAGVKTIRQSCNSSRVRNPAPLGCVSCLIFIYTWYIFLLYKYFYIFFYLGDFLFFFFKEHRVTNTRTRLLVLVSPPHQVYSFRRRTKCVRLLTPQAMKYTPFCPFLIDLPHTRSGSPLTSSIPLPVTPRAV